MFDKRLTFTGMQKSMRRRSAVAKPPKKTLVGVAGKGLSLGHNVEPMMTTFPEIKLYITFSPKSFNIVLQSILVHFTVINLYLHLTYFHIFN